MSFYIAFANKVLMYYLSKVTISPAGKRHLKLFSSSLNLNMCLSAFYFRLYH